MKDLVNFQYEDHKVRTVFKDGLIWFVAKDICECLELNDVRRAVERLDNDECSLTPLTDASARKQDMYIVNEFGLYNLILGSRKAEAKAFKRWVTHEVLPAIRKDGAYVKEKPDMSLEYQGKTIMIQSLMNERLALLGMNREIIKQIKLLEKRVCVLEDCSGLLATSRGKPTVHIGSTNADESTGLFVEFVFGGKGKSFSAMNTFLQSLETFLIVNGYHQEKELI